MPIKSKIMELFKKRYICNKPIHKEHDAKFPSNIFIFGCGMAKKGKGDDVTS